MQVLFSIFTSNFGEILTMEYGGESLCGIDYWKRSDKQRDLSCNYESHLLGFIVCLIEKLIFLFLNQIICCVHS